MHSSRFFSWRLLDFITMLRIRSKYGLPLGQYSENTTNQLSTGKDGPKSATEMKKGLISYHNYLIYRGVLARYKGLTFAHRYSSVRFCNGRVLRLVVSIARLFERLEFMRIISQIWRDKPILTCEIWRLEH